MAWKIKCILQPVGLHFALIELWIHIKTKQIYCSLFFNICFQIMKMKFMTRNGRAQNAPTPLAASLVISSFTLKLFIEEKIMVFAAILLTKLLSCKSRLRNLFHLILIYNFIITDEGIFYSFDSSIVLFSFSKSFSTN